MKRPPSSTRYHRHHPQCCPSLLQSPHTHSIYLPRAATPSSHFYILPLALLLYRKWCRQKVGQRVGSWKWVWREPDRTFTAEASRHSSKTFPRSSRLCQTNTSFIKSDLRSSLTTWIISDQLLMKPSVIYRVRTAESDKPSTDWHWADGDPDRAEPRNKMWTAEQSGRCHVSRPLD